MLASAAARRRFELTTHVGHFEAVREMLRRISIETAPDCALQLQRRSAPKFDSG